MRIRSLIVVLAACANAPGAFAQQVVRYEPAEKDLKFVYATAPRWRRSEDM